MIKSFAFCASMTQLVWLLTANSCIAVISSLENQASVKAFVCCGAVFAVPLFDTKEDRIICVMFGSLVVYTALLFHCTLGLANAIDGVALIIGTSTFGVGSSIAIFVCASSIVGAFDFFIGGIPPIIVDPAVAVVALPASSSFCVSNPFCTPSMIAVIIGTAD